MSKCNGKKIGILNFQYSEHNYGAVLQAAALEFTLRSMGFDAVHLDFRPKRKFSLRLLSGKLLRSLGIKRALNASKTLNKETFERYREKNITRTRTFSSRKEFFEVSGMFGAVIVGSDQVWRPKMSFDPKAFFLTYLPESVERISYAASFGVDAWELGNDKKETDLVKTELKKFKAISCREISGVNICKSYFDVEAVHVLDPLLLVSDQFFTPLLSEFKSKKNVPSVVYYKLDKTEDFNRSIIAIGEKYESEPFDIYVSKVGQNQSYQEVSDWVGYVYNSSVVVTDSYHCICLALRFGKDVYYSPNPNRGQSRLDSIFKVFGISVNEPESSELVGVYKLEINSFFNEVLNQKRAESMNFLVLALNS